MPAHKSKKIELNIDEIRKLINQIEDQDLHGLAKITRLSWYPGQLLPELEIKSISNKFDANEVFAITLNIISEYYKWLCAQYPEHINEFKNWNFNKEN